ncbi:hypothetical protein [Paenibacillus sp. NAIST15-1]|uniref:hypothetical protein n=1 Tax=Paenibacillus sp. NAIST15-1 TaxID=1605994 RepID=UPI000AAC40FB|nr:hypothetical protein [Paenibacillus sp. NAIST15-1]
MSEINKIKVFPIPYAGASVNVYCDWKKLLPDRCVYVNWLEEELDSQSLATSLLVKQVKISQKE